MVRPLAEAAVCCRWRWSLCLGAVRLRRWPFVGREWPGAPHRLTWLSDPAFMRSLWSPGRPERPGPRRFGAQGPYRQASLSSGASGLLCTPWRLLAAVPVVGLTTVALIPLSGPRQVRSPLPVSGASAGWLAWYRRSVYWTGGVWRCCRCMFRPVASGVHCRGERRHQATIQPLVRRWIIKDRYNRWGHSERVGWRGHEPDRP